MSYIEREPLLEILNGLYDHHLTMHNYAADGATQDCINAVIEAPTADVVEVVRCKDCKHAAINERHPDRPLICFLTRMVGAVKPGWYCWQGERKENEISNSMP